MDELDEIANHLSDAYFAVRHRKPQDAITALNRVHGIVRLFKSSSPEMNIVYWNMHTLTKDIWRYWPHSRDKVMGGVADEMQKVSEWRDCRRAA